MSISIVIPAYNAEQYLGHTLDSVKHQAYRDWEAVVVDDGSTDGTAEIVRQYASNDSRFRLISQPNAGVVAARNFGNTQTRTDYPFVLFLDADDLLLPSGLNIFLKSILCSPSSPAIYGQPEYIDAHGQPIPNAWQRRTSKKILKDGRSHEDALENPATLNHLVVENCIAAPSVVLIKKDALKRVEYWRGSGSFDPTADWDLWFRLSQIGPIPTVSESVAAYRVHSTSMSQNRSGMRSSIRMMRKLWLSESDALLRTKIRRGLIASLDNLAAAQLKNTKASIRSKSPKIVAVNSIKLGYACCRSLAARVGHV